MRRRATTQSRGVRIPPRHWSPLGGGFIDFTARAPIFPRVNPSPAFEPSTDKSLALKAAFEPISGGLLQVEERIRSQARAFDPAVEAYVAYAIESHGKRLRPALALLAGGATGAILPDHENLAVIVELIHAATLVHDDILDEADTRRAQPTANARWGNSLAVLLGDCLFAHSLRLAAAFDDNRMCRRIAQAASEVCSGEIVQTQRRFDLQLSVPDYYRILEMKTGALFAVATELGALLNGASAEVMESLHRFGMRLGTAYQIYDDCLDLAGNEATVGKTLGTDLRRGKLTLPVLHLLQTSRPEERERLSQLILEGREEEIRGLVDQAVQTGAVRFAVATGRRMLTEAQEALHTLPASPYRQSLEQLCLTLDAMIAPLADVGRTPADSTAAVAASK
ncbi:MAG: hypothetical protein RLZZ399_1630 [Verrucomicrobiota bacterium]